MKPEYEESLRKLIIKLVAESGVQYLQVGSEAENEWLDPAGFVKALSIVYEAAKSANPDIKIMTFGFNPAEYFLNPAIYAGTKAEEILSFSQEVIKDGHNYFDIFCFHANRSYEAIAPTMQWIQDQMSLHNAEKPIWIDDMYSGPWLAGSDASNQEKALLENMVSGNPQAIQYFDSIQAVFLVKKVGSAFASGVERLFVSTDVDWPHYYIPMWHFGGLLKVDGQKKPAFYTLSNLVNHLDRFYACEKVKGDIYRFEKTDAVYFLAWSENSEILNLNELSIEGEFELIKIVSINGANEDTKIISEGLQLTEVPILLRVEK